jgi:hypothetical protein
LKVPVSCWTSFLLFEDSPNQSVKWPLADALAGLSAVKVAVPSSVSVNVGLLRCVDDLVARDGEQMAGVARVTGVVASGVIDHDDAVVVQGARLRACAAQIGKRRRRKLQPDRNSNHSSGHRQPPPRLTKPQK